MFEQATHSIFQILMCYFFFFFSQEKLGELEKDNDIF